MALCVCHIAAEFPILGNLGIISANLRTNTDVTVTEGGLVLYGPAFGDLSVTASLSPQKCPAISPFFVGMVNPP